MEGKPVYSWRDAVVRFINENQHKRSIASDKSHLRWLDKHLREFQLHEITKETIEEIAKKRKNENVSCTTVNRMLELIRSLLKRAKNEWEWIDKVPVIRMRHIEKKRIRWLTIEEANRLLNELPSHLKEMAAFTLATGLRASNVLELQWQDIDLKNRHAWIHPDKAKAKKAIPVPLNEHAISVLRNCAYRHKRFVFTYKNNPIGQCNTKAWRKALKRASISNFRWHDLRHTWASWHIQNGTSLQELQMLGGWASLDMVLRYAHLSSNHLRSAAEKINSIKIVK